MLEYANFIASPRNCFFRGYNFLSPIWTWGTTAILKYFRKTKYFPKTNANFLKNLCFITKDIISSRNHEFHSII